MAAEFYDASDDVVALARDIIQEYHSHLVEAKIKYLFRTGNWEVKKRETWGQAKKVGKEVNFLTGYDFIVTVHRDVWEQLNEEEKRALLDHELQHCSAGTDDAGNKIWYIQGHDVEDFYAIIRRHGLWSKALRKMEGLLNQTELDLEPQPEESLPELPAAPEMLELTGKPTLQIVGPQVKALPEADDEEAFEPEEQSDIIDAEVIESSTVRDTGTEG